jgi:hypothetical protein
LAARASTKRCDQNEKSSVVRKRIFIVAARMCACLFLGLVITTLEIKTIESSEIGHSQVQ